MALAVDQATLGTTAEDASATTIALTTTQAVVSGGFVVLFAGWSNGSETLITGVSGGGLTWAVDEQGKHGGASSHSAIIRAQAPSGLATSTAITVTLASASTDRGVAGSSFTGVETSSPVDTTEPANLIGGPTTSWATSNTTTANADDLLVGLCVAEVASGTSTLTSAGTELHDFGPSFRRMTTAYRIVSGAGTYNFTGTWSSSTDLTGSTIVSYKAAVGSPPITDAPEKIRLVQSNLRW